MYTSRQFGIELQEKIKNRLAIDEIGNWAFSVYIARMLEIDLNLRQLLLKLSVMEQGPEFARSYEELEDIADKLIAGQDVTL